MRSYRAVTQVPLCKIALAYLLLVSWNALGLHAEQEPSAQQEEKEAIQYLELIYPYKIDTILRLKQESPSEYASYIKKLLMEKRHIERLAKNDQESYQNYLKQRELDRQIWSLAQKFNQTENPTAKTMILAQLEQSVSDLFDMKDQQKQQEIKRLEQELTKLKALAELRRQNKQDIVRQHTQELIAGKEFVDW